MAHLFVLAISFGGLTWSHGAFAETTWPHVGVWADRVVDPSRATYFVSVEGDDGRDGRSAATALRTMQKAADVVKPGETVLVLRGVYPSGFHYKGVGQPGKYVTFRAEPGVEIRGSDVRKDWQPAREKGVYFIERPKLHGHWQRPETELFNRTEQVFVNGQLLRMVPDRAMLKPTGTFYVDDGEKRLLVCLADGKDPNGELTEVSLRTWAIAIGGPPNNNSLSQPQFDKLREECRTSHVRIDGFRIRHIANFSRNGAIQIRGLCSYILVENCDVQWVNHGGINVSDGEHVIFRNNVASNCGVQGMGSGGTSHLLFENNVLDNNNYKGVSPWSEGGAIKTGFWGTHIVMRGNVARNNHNHALWIDYGGPNCIIENNFVFNAVAGAILNEVTPNPEQSAFADGSLCGEKEPKAETIRRFQQRGTIIRNNVLVGTRAPGGGGINISSSSDGRIYNNIVVANVGGGLNYGGSFDRPHTAGQARNRCWANLAFDNFQHATVLRQEDDRYQRTFGNVMEGNLFAAARGDPPLRIGGKGATPDEFEAYNSGAKNVYESGPIFRNPTHFDFTLARPDLAAQVGFEPSRLRLDWSEFYVPASDSQSKSVRKGLEFVPIDLASLFNRGLTDETAGDGRGGWTDQGPRDLRHLPVGRQRFDGVPYDLGTLQHGAILLKNGHVKPGPLPDTVTVPVDGALDEVYFLYAAVAPLAPAKGSTAPAEIARIVVTHADGNKTQQPLLLGSHVLEWSFDPTWQDSAKLNDNNAYLAWQGPGGHGGQVNVYYLRWVNEQPANRIRSIAITNAGATAADAFLLLGITGARAKAELAAGQKARVFNLTWDGEVDGADHNGDEIVASGFNRTAFDAGQFVDGVRGKAFRPSKALTYPMPAAWPGVEQGTVRLWLNADAIFTPERLDKMRRASYLSVMWPLQSESMPKQPSPCEIQFHVDVEKKTLTLKTHIYGVGLSADATKLVEPGKWFNVALQWGPVANNRTEFVLLLDGKPLATRVENRRPEARGMLLRMGVPGNGGQPWVGAMDEMEVWNYRLDADELAQPLPK
jgi:hypothetical protein